MKIRISVSSSFYNRRHCSGFTLIELLVVLAIVGALGALAGPNMWNSYQRANERYQVLGVANQLMERRRQAHFQGESLHVPENYLVAGTLESPLLQLPPGWVIESHTKIYFLPSGATNGGLILLISPLGRQWKLFIQPLDGRVTVTSS